MCSIIRTYHYIHVYSVHVGVVCDMYIHMHVVQCCRNVFVLVRITQWSVLKCKILTQTIISCGYCGYILFADTLLKVPWSNWLA